MAKVGIFDSGVGGLSVLREIRKVLPGDDCIYFADNANCPYGTRDRNFIIDRAREISRFLIGEGCDIIVVACNTATAAAISTLRAEFPIKFIGMEPAVKLAAENTSTGVIGILATTGTLAADKYKDTKGRFGNDARIVERVGQGFVELVENGDLESPHSREVVGQVLLPILEEKADRIVLGCTHYPFLEATMLKIIEDFRTKHHTDYEIELIDPAPAVVRQLAKVMEAEGIRHGKEGKIILHSSGDGTVLHKLYGTISAK